MGGGGGYVTVYAMSKLVEDGAGERGGMGVGGWGDGEGGRFVYGSFVTAVTVRNTQLKVCNTRDQKSSGIYIEST